jgi:hypothetical protein
MSAPATIPFNAPTTNEPPSANQQPSPSDQPNAKPKRREWNPSSRDRLIFQWVKFDGHTQGWVAQQLELNQSTVSRIVERHERWIARGGPGRQGGLTYDERLRYQRWLTYERNEWVIGASFRIAAEMERGLDTSKSTTTTNASRPSKETQVRTEYKVLDRSGMAARFLRLAHRVTMEQLALVQQEALPELEPLMIDEADELDLDQETQKQAWRGQETLGQQEGQEECATAPDSPNRTTDVAADVAVEPCPAAMHCVHNGAPAQTCSCADSATTCAANTAAEKPFSDAYAAGDYPPEITEVRLSASGLSVHTLHAPHEPVLIESLVSAPEPLSPAP